MYKCRNCGAKFVQLEQHGVYKNSTVIHKMEV